MKRNAVFEHLIKSPFVWFFEAAGLLRAAFVVWNVHQIKFDRMMDRPDGPMTKDELSDQATDRFVSCYMLLSGLGVENLLKGLIVSKMSFPRQLRGLPKELKEHDIEKLSRIAGVQLNAKEELVAEALTETILWKGRYPSPLRASDLCPVYPVMALGKRFYHPQDIAELFRRVANEYPESIWEHFGGANSGLPKDLSEWMKWVGEECPTRPQKAE